MAFEEARQTGLNMFHLYVIYTYSERGHSGLQKYVLFGKSNFLRKINCLRRGPP